MEQHITKPISSFWLHMAALTAVFFLLRFMDPIQSLLLKVLFFLVVVVIVSIVSSKIELYLFGYEIILSDKGIETTGRIGAKITAWDDIIQVGVMEEGMTKVLVLIKKGGKPMGEKTLQDWFILRNPWKLIWPPDDKFTRAFVAKYYGPLGFDRLWKKEE